MIVKRLAPGLYEVNGRHDLEQDTEGLWGPKTDWWIRINGRNQIGPYLTKREALADLAKILGTQAPHRR